MSTEQIRSFIAIELPDDIKRELGRLETRLKSDRQTHVKWVNPDSIHLTLKFLGDFGAGKVGEITAVIKESVREISPFNLVVDGTGVFPSLKKAQVAWVGLRGDMDKLLWVRRQIESGLVELGFDAESRAFSPHLTLARIQRQATPDERKSFGLLMTSAVFETATTIKVTGISLMQSQLTRQGAIYKRLALIDIKDVPSSTS